MSFRGCFYNKEIRNLMLCAILVESYKPADFVPQRTRFVVKKSCLMLFLELESSPVIIAERSLDS